LEIAEKIKWRLGEGDRVDNMLIYLRKFLFIKPSRGKRRVSES
jgi:hypothetical protein